MPLTRHSPPWLPTPLAGVFSHVVAVDPGGCRQLEVSGQMAVGPDGSVLAPGDVAAQSEHVFAVLARLLGEHGAGFADVTRIRAYLTDMGRVGEYGAVLRRHVTGHPPASTTVEVSRLFHPGAVVEVELTAWVPA